MLLIAVCFTAGIGCERLMHMNGITALSVIAVTSAAALILRGKTATATVLVGAAFVMCGWLASSLEAERNNAHSRLRVIYDSGRISSSAPAEVEGIVNSTTETGPNGSSLILRAISIRTNEDEMPATGNIRLFFAANDERAGELRYGERVRVGLKLERENEYQNPGVLSKIDLLDRQDVDATATVKSGGTLQILSEGTFSMTGWIYVVRKNVIERFREQFSPQTAGVMIASLLGDKEYLDKQTADLYREGGTFHILVISGLHITFIGGLLLILARALTRRRWMQFAMTAAPLWAYTIAVGCELPVMRAAVMFTAELAGYAYYRLTMLANMYGLSILILLIWRPQDMFDPSFHLTAVSVGSIVLCVFPLLVKLRQIGEWTPDAAHPFPPNVPKLIKRLCETLFWNDARWIIEKKQNVWTATIAKEPFAPQLINGAVQRWLRYAVEGIIVSVIVQLWMLPLTVIYFHRISFSGIVNNLWTGFFIAIESFAAVAGVLVNMLSGYLAKPLFALAEIADQCTLFLPRWFSAAGLNGIRLPAYSGNAAIVYMAYTVPLIGFAVLIHRWDPFATVADHASVKRKCAAITAAAAIGVAVVIGHPFSHAAADGKLHVDLIDVGQGDSALVTFPDGRTMLIDGGGRPDIRRERNADDEEFQPDISRIGERVVSSVLWAKGYSHIDTIIATHGDADHIQGLSDVASNFDIGSAVLARLPSSDPDIAEFTAVLDRRHIPLEVVGAGDTFDIGGARVEVLYPTGDEPGGVSDNDHSAVIRITFGSRTFLFTGDIEKTAEASILSSSSDLRADVIKVAHHGSRTSSTQALVDAVKPRFAAISVSRHSPFGHPHREVVERWLASGADVLITGYAGMISFETDGENLQCTTFAAGSCKE